MKNSLLIIFFIALFLGIGFFALILGNEKHNIFAHKNVDVFLRVDKIRDIKIQKQHQEKPEHIRAIYMSSWVGGNKKLRSQLMHFIDRSRINAVVLDIKDYSGYISFPVEDEFLRQFNTSSNRIKDIDDFILELHNNNIYVIGRITTFQDPILAKRIPQFAFKRKDNGTVWTDRKGLAFIDPQKEEVWKYLVALARESYNRGFDEINFDYIRYPSDGNIANINYALNGNTKFKVIKKFYQYLDEHLRKQEGILISADLFGFVASRKNGIPGIGQKLTDALPYFDAVAPMVYPSHYPRSYLGFDNPAAHPYEIVFHEIDLAQKTLESLNLPKSHLRTWIQDFDMGAPYGVNEVHQEIKASYDAGVYSYMVWDAANHYTKNAYYKNILDEVKKYEYDTNKQQKTPEKQ